MTAVRVAATAGGAFICGWVAPWDWSASLLGLAGILFAAWGPI